MGSSLNESPTQTNPLKMFSGPNYDRDLSNFMEKWQINKHLYGNWTNSSSTRNYELKADAESTDETNDFIPNSKEKITAEICHFKLFLRSQDTEFCQFSPFISSWLGGRGRCAAVAAVSSSARRCDLFSCRAHQVWDCEKIEMLKIPLSSTP